MKIEGLDVRKYEVDGKVVRMVTLQELQNRVAVRTWSCKDDSPRGVREKIIENVVIGDEVVIANYFTLVVESYPE